MTNPDDSDGLVKLKPSMDGISMSVLPPTNNQDDDQDDEGDLLLSTSLHRDRRDPFDDSSLAVKD